MQASHVIRKAEQAADVAIKTTESRLDSYRLPNQGDSYLTAGQLITRALNQPTQSPKDVLAECRKSSKKLLTKATEDVSAAIDYANELRLLADYIEGGPEPIDINPVLLERGKQVRAAARLGLVDAKTTAQRMRKALLPGIQELEHTRDTMLAKRWPAVVRLVRYKHASKMFDRIASQTFNQKESDSYRGQADTFNKLHARRAAEYRKAWRGK